MEDTVLLATEPKYLMDRTTFYWNPLCPDNRLRVPAQCTLSEISKIRIPVEIVRNGQLLKPTNNLPEDLKANSRRIE